MKHVVSNGAAVYIGSRNRFWVNIGPAVYAGSVRYDFCDAP